MLFRKRPNKNMRLFIPFLKYMKARKSSMCAFCNVQKTNVDRFLILFLATIGLTLIYLLYLRAKYTIDKKQGQELCLK